MRPTSVTATTEDTALPFHSEQVCSERGREKERERANSTRPKGVCTRETKGLNYRCNLDLARQSEGSFLLPCQI
jgi:hypothetical protein